MTEDIQLSDNKIIGLRLCCGLSLGVNLVTFLFAVINSCNHVYRHKKIKTLIVSFYFFLFLNATANITMLLMIIADPIKAVKDKNLEGNIRSNLVVVMASTNIGIYITLGLTMFQLGLSIQIVFKEITVCKAKRRKITGYLLGFTVFCAFPCLTILVFKTVREFFLILTIFAVGLTIVLLITLKFLT